MIKNTIISILATLVVVSGIYFYNNNEEKQSFRGNVWNSTQVSTASTTTRVAVTSNTRLLATTTQQLVYMSICNDDASTKVYLGLDGDKPMTAFYGIPLSAGSCYTINDQNLYTGSIRASSTNETSTNLNITLFTL